MGGELWIAFIAAVCALLALDLGVFHRRAHTPTFGEALAWTLFWVMLSLGFSVAVYYIYQYQGLDGGKAALEFFAGYVVEKSLSFDNIFVIALIFSYFQVPLQDQHRVLAWGIFGAIAMRMAMILFGTALILRFSWMFYGFGAFLVYSAVKMLVEEPRQYDPEHHLSVRLARKLFPVTADFHGSHFFIRQAGVLCATPLFIALLQVEATDALFAIDSIPAVFAVTTDPFLVFTSNICAILGLRALYFALAGLLHQLRYFKVSLVFVLLFVGMKMLLGYFFPIPLLLSLAIILGLLIGGAFLSLLAPPRAEKVETPLTHDLQEMLLVTWNQGRRIVMLVFGITILLLGIAMIVLPGPAMILIPLGLAMLAREFIWARRLLKTLKQKGSQFFGRGGKKP